MSDEQASRPKLHIVHTDRPLLVFHGMPKILDDPTMLHDWQQARETLISQGYGVLWFQYDLDITESTTAPGPLDAAVPGPAGEKP